jgi:hypothetical protein
MTRSPLLFSTQVSTMQSSSSKRETDKDGRREEIIHRRSSHTKLTPVDDASGLIEYTGTWELAGTQQDFNTTTHRTTSNSATATYQFFGTVRESLLSSYIFAGAHLSVPRVLESMEHFTTAYPRALHLLLSL